MRAKNTTQLLERNIRINVFTISYIWCLPRTFPLVFKPSSAKNLSNYNQFFININYSVDIIGCAQDHYTIQLIID